MRLSRKLRRTSLAASALAVASYTVALRVESTGAAVLLTVLATVLAFGPLFRWGPGLLTGPEPFDERTELIHYRAGWYSYWLLLAWVLLYKALGASSENVSETHPLYVLRNARHVGPGDRKPGRSNRVAEVDLQLRAAR